MKPCILTAKRRAESILAQQPAGSTAEVAPSAAFPAATYWRKRADGNLVRILAGEHFARIAQQRAA